MSGSESAHVHDAPKSQTLGLPGHWQTRQLRTLSRRPIQNGVGESAKDFSEDLPRYIRITDIAGASLLREDTRASLPWEEAEKAKLERGDLLIAAVGATYGKSYLHVDDEQPACFAGYLVRVTPNKEVLPEFLSYWTQSSHYWDQVNQQVIQSTIQNFSAARVKRLVVPIPPLSHQAAIVRFLDHADRRIRRAIRAKQQLIALLNEQKQVAIHRAVTRGLDPDVPLKPSGVDWIGSVPEHWDVLRVKNVLRVVDERSTTGLETLLSLRREHGVVVFADHFSRPPQAVTTVGYKLVAPSQIVVNRLQANNGLIFRSPVAGLISPDYSVLSVVRDANPDYVAALFRMPHYRAHFRRSARGLGTGTAGFLRLYDDELLATSIALPPRHEQDRIMASLEDASTEEADAISAAERAVNLLREYRTRLITDVVTGKFDVREAAARLPEDAGGPEPLDVLDVEESDTADDEELEAIEA